MRRVHTQRQEGNAMAKKDKKDKGKKDKGKKKNK